MGQASICGLGQVAANPITTVLKCFPEELKKRLSLGMLCMPRAPTACPTSKGSSMSGADELVPVTIDGNLVHMPRAMAVCGVCCVEVRNKGNR